MTPGTSKTLKTLCIFGTRPEVIKMAPVLAALEAHPACKNQVCVTGQHREMLHAALQLFDIHPEYSLDVMQANQTLSGLTARMLTAVTEVLSTAKPDLVLVHGDTTTTFVAALSAFYQQIPVAHVEAGLRTHQIHLPFPEEANRHLTGVLSHYHFVPTVQAQQNLLAEGVAEDRIVLTGNTVIDALLMTVARLESDTAFQLRCREAFPFLQTARKMVLVTGHRRENFGQGFDNICHALRHLAQKFPEVDFVYPVHLNPHVQEPVHNILSGLHNIHLIAPQNYEFFVYLMQRSYLILTDSGGVQEEAPSLGKPVLVMRDTTERPEAVAAGTARLVGTDADRIMSAVSQLLEDPLVYNTMHHAQNPYGDGRAAGRIVHFLVERLL